MNYINGIRKNNQKIQNKAKSKAKKLFHNKNPIFLGVISLMVREMGIEPTRQSQRCLRPSRLPIPPLSHELIIT